ncbi:hypothetical protein RCL1_004013 [Eukaryota sp. TZLM3-RCL]
MFFPTVTDAFKVLFEKELINDSIGNFILNKKPRVKCKIACDQRGTPVIGTAHQDESNFVYQHFKYHGHETTIEELIQEQRNLDQTVYDIINIRPHARLDVIDQLAASFRKMVPIDATRTRVRDEISITRDGKSINYYHIQFYVWPIYGYSGQ